MLLIAHSVASDAGRAQGAAPDISADLPVTAINLARERAQNSPMVAVDPGDSRYVALASRVDGPTFDCDLHVSGDGGRTWQPAQPVPTIPEGADRCYNPEVVFGPDGVLYYLFVGLQGQGNSPMGVFLTQSKDRQAFTAPRLLLGPQRYMVRLALDRSVRPNGRLHLVWLEPSEPPRLGGFSAGLTPILSAFSDDAGATFSPPVRVSDPSRERTVAPAVAIGGRGDVHVVYFDLLDDRRDYEGLEGPTWDGTWEIVVSSSLDRGATFTEHTLAVSSVVPTNRVMLIFTMPPPAIEAADDGVWIAWDDGRDGDRDVFVARSQDRGRTFAEPVPVVTGSERGVVQYLPHLTRHPSGALAVLFYDRRDSDDGRMNDTYLSVSHDLGVSFGPAVRLTSASSFHRTGPRYAVPSARGLVEFGSRLDIVPWGTGLIAAWTDTRNVRLDNLHQDIYATVVELGAASLQSDNSTGSGRDWWALMTVGAVLGILVTAWRSRARRPWRTPPRVDGRTGG